jgi:hypothetical protein
MKKMGEKISGGKTGQRGGGIKDMLITLMLLQNNLK